MFSLLAVNNVALHRKQCDISFKNNLYFKVAFLFFIVFFQLKLLLIDGSW